MLDLKFSLFEQDVFAVATSTGAVEMYKVDVNRRNLTVDVSIEILHTVQAFESIILVLSLAWCPSPKRKTVFAVSLSDGTVALVDYSESPSKRITICAHSLEAWTVAWSDDRDAIEPSLITGGDDSRICFYSADLLTQNVDDIHAKDSKAEIISYNTTDAADFYFEKQRMVSDHSGQSSAHILSKPSGFDQKIHGAGVTSILPLSARLIVTGSYDENVRIITSTPGPKGNQWAVLQEKRLGGGVWRLKLLATQNKYSKTRDDGMCYQILASCMHAGPCVIYIRVPSCASTDRDCVIEVYAKLEEHGSMNYGTDASPSRGNSEAGEQATCVVSTSFYDRKLCVWNIPDISV